jgi:OmpA-OmpF porin, OOP family
VVVLSQGLTQSDAVLVAHYGDRGRDLWASLHHSGDEYQIEVGDAGGDSLSRQLAQDCHVALRGVLFDFNKATLKPESESVLLRARDALTSNPRLAIEVQGHTDNVGGDDYNVTLSDQRAASVMTWLVGHGIPAGRLTARGYGRKVPVASNDSAEGRAQNRRVELACQK